MKEEKEIIITQAELDRMRKYLKDNNIKLNIDPALLQDSKLKLSDKKVQQKMSEFDVNEIIQRIKTKIIGQDPVVEAVVANVYANQRMIATGNKDLISQQKVSILVDGPTGTGKTAIMKEVAEQLSLPIIIVSVNDYTMKGYRGGDLTDIFRLLLQEANGDIGLAQRGIVVLDEIDKLCQIEDHNSAEFKRGLQRELLTYIGGSTIDLTSDLNKAFTGSDKKASFDTTNVTFIGMGAFTRIREDKEMAQQQSRKPTIGFGQVEPKTSSLDTESDYEVTSQDYIKYGMERELVGRFALLTSTKAFSIEDYRNILLHSTISPLTAFKEFSSTFGVNVQYDDDFVQRMSEMAYEMQFGARGLQKLMADVKNSRLLQIMDKGTTELTLSAETLSSSKHGKKGI